MRAIAFTVVCFFYILSISAYVVDATILSQTALFSPLALDGSPLDPEALLEEAEEFRDLGNRTANPSDGGDSIIDRIGKAIEASYASAWVVIDLITGTYVFNILYAIGIDPVLVTVVKLIMPILIASQVIWYIAGRY